MSRALGVPRRRLSQHESFSAAALNKSRAIDVCPGKTWAFVLASGGVFWGISPSEETLGIAGDIEDLDITSLVEISGHWSSSE